MASNEKDKMTSLTELVKTNQNFAQKAPKQIPGYYHVRDLGKFGFTSYQIHYWIKKGVIKSKKLGKYSMVPKSHFNGFMQRLANSYSPEEAAEILGIHPVNVRKRIRSKEIKAFEIGNTYRVPKNKLEKFMENHIYSSGRWYEKNDLRIKCLRE